jgi:hypothetical protein
MLQYMHKSFKVYFVSIFYVAHEPISWKFMEFTECHFLFAMSVIGEGIIGKIDRPTRPPKRL